jgi:hypothetical protein
MDCKFPEPRGWALRWEGTALFATTDCESQPDDALDVAAPSIVWAPQWRQIAAATLPGYRNGKGKDGLTWSRGWALQWEGSALIDGVDGQVPAHLGAAEFRKVGAA